MKGTQNLNLQNFKLNIDEIKKNNINTKNFKASGEENENNNLFAYELYEKADAFDFEDFYSQRESEPKLKICKSNGSNSTNNIFSNKTTPFSKAQSQVTNFKDTNKEKAIQRSKKFDENLEELNEEHKQAIVQNLLKLDFNKSRQKNISPIYTERVKSSESRNNNICLSYGERLYNKGIAFREQSCKSINEIRNKQKKMEMKECTFTPTCSSSNIVNIKAMNRRLGFKSPTSSKNIHINSNFEGKLNNLKNNTNRENNKNITNKLSLADDLLTFKPTRKKRESELLQLSQKLFTEAERRKYDKEKLAREYYNECCPFKPTINDNSPEESKPNIDNFFFRLQNWVEKRNEKYLKDMDKVNYDSKTGLRLFSPNIKDNEEFPKKYLLNEHNRNKFFDLFSEWKTREVKGQELKLQQHKEYLEMNKINYMSPKSRELSEELTKKIFQKIFEIIVDPYKNVVDADANFTYLPEKIYQIITPLIQELHEQNETLSNFEFSDACNHLYNLLQIDQKQFLYEWYFSTLHHNKQEEQKNLSFKPQINKNSEKLVSKNFKNNFYQRTIEFLQNKERKLKSEIEKKKINDVPPEGTFNPNLINKSNSRVASYYYNKFKNEENKEIGNRKK